MHSKYKNNTHPKRRQKRIDNRPRYMQISASMRKPRANAPAKTKKVVDLEVLRLDLDGEVFKLINIL